MFLVLLLPLKRVLRYKWIASSTATIKDLKLSSFKMKIIKLFTQDSIRFRLVLVAHCLLSSLRVLPNFVTPKSISPHVTTLFIGKPQYENAWISRFYMSSLNRMLFWFPIRHKLSLFLGQLNPNIVVWFHVYCAAGQSGREYCLQTYLLKRYAVSSFSNNTRNIT